MTNAAPVFDRPAALMAILNLTPDSFSDGGRYADPTAAVDQALQWVAAGASVIDVGGESTRPGFTPVSASEQIRRILPVIRRLAESSNVLISVDTANAQVARSAIEAGARMVNDVSGGLFDEKMAETAARFNVSVVLGHLRGTPAVCHEIIETDDIVRLVAEDLAARRDAFLAAGVDREKIFLDPGIGFGKTARQNFELLENISAFKSLGCRLAVGVSRKRFLGGETLAEKDRLTAEWTERLRRLGVDLVRVHRIDRR